MTLAKMFAQAAIGETDMGQDVDCQDATAMLDLIVIQPEIVETKGVIKQRDIPIEAIRNAQQTLSLFPYRGKYKVLIVDDAHRMKGSPQNALLKLLEEPNQTSILILVTSELDKILPTVQSRCEKVNFSLVPQNEIERSFEVGKMVPDLGELSMGRPGIARLMMENPEELEMRRKLQQQLRKLKEGSISDRLQLAEDFSKDIGKALGVFNSWIWFLRSEALVCEDEKRRNELFGVIEKIQKNMALLKNTNANARLLMEVLFVEI